jgi:hypothetical protein
MGTHNNIKNIGTQPCLNRASSGTQPCLNRASSGTQPCLKRDSTGTQPCLKRDSKSKAHISSSSRSCTSHNPKLLGSARLRSRFWSYVSYSSFCSPPSIFHSFRFIFLSFFQPTILVFLTSCPCFLFSHLTFSFLPLISFLFLYLPFCLTYFSNYKPAEWKITFCKLRSVEWTHNTEQRTWPQPVTCVAIVTNVNII